MKQNGTERTTSKYVTIAEKEHVLVKVPTLVKVPGYDCKYKYMEIVPAHSFTTRGGTEVKVEEHWKHGQLVDKRVDKQGKPMYKIVNRHFFGITREDCGRKIIATVKVVLKTVVDPTTGDEKEYIMLNITREPETTRASCKMVFAKQRTKGAGDIYVKGSEYYLRFKPLPSKEELETAQHGHAEQATDQPANATN